VEREDEGSLLENLKTSNVNGEFLWYLKQFGAAE